MSSNKLFVLSYHEVQIAGFRIFNSYDEALKEYLRHCIIETRELLSENEEPVSDAESSNEDSINFDEMSCVLEVQELQNTEYVTLKEFDYEQFQALIENIDDVEEYLDVLETKIDADEISEEILKLFAQ